MILEIVILALLGIQLLYWILLFIGISKDSDVKEVMNVPVSVIVCAHDEEENLKDLIPLLLNQQHSEFEVIIVNDCSNDGTSDLLRELTKQDHRLKIVTVNHRPEHVNGKKFGLTLAIKAARYDWLLFTDADCRPSSSEWLKQMAASFTESNSFVLGYSPYYKAPGLLNSFIRFETILTALQFLGLANIGKPYMATGRNLAYRKKIFLDNKGFNAHLNVTGGDDDLFVNQYGLASNTKTVLHPKALMYSHPKKSWSEFYNQKIRHLAVGKKYNAGSRLILGPFMITWILFWPVMIYSLSTSIWIWALGGYLLRLLSMFLTFNAFEKKSGEEFEDWKIPLLDFIFCFYYLVAGFGALFTKRIQWKKI